MQLVIIGRNWLTIQDRQGKRRLDDPKDTVRFEIETALNSRMTVIPILVDGAQFPTREQLPRGRGFLVRRKGLDELALLKGREVRSDDDGFEQDVLNIIEEVRAILFPGALPRRQATAVPKEDLVARGKLQAQVTADLSRGGVLSRLPGFEVRPEQIKMAQMVAAAIEGRHSVVIEAGTGTGKSQAYLLPIIRSGQVAIVSTANKALQDQLSSKDIPFLRKQVRNFASAVVKGMGNYLCLDRLQEALNTTPPHAALASMLQLVDKPQKWDGDFDKLKVALPPEIRERVKADYDLCAWQACPYFNVCYVRQMRANADGARVIIANHTLLMLDAAKDGALLPPHDIVVVDEAHHLEDEATQVFTTEVSPGRIHGLLSQPRVRAYADIRLIQGIQQANQHLWTTVANAVPDTKGNGRYVLKHAIQEGLHLGAEIDELADSLAWQQPANLSDKDEVLFQKVLQKTRSLAEDLREVFSVNDFANRVYYVQYEAGTARRNPELVVCAAPLSVADILRPNLFDRGPVVLTSATLSVSGSFTAFCSRVGLPNVETIVLDSSFDYQTNALLYVPHMRHSPEFRGPNEQAYFDELAEEMGELVRASAGRAFLLFSSQRALAAVSKRIGDQLQWQGYYPVVQGPIERMEMLDQFRTQRKAVLFGLKSFWEGVDVIGEQLSLVAIDKMPFDPPDDPVFAARKENMKRRGEDWFYGYALNRAITQLRQGIGRLLRTRSDRGVMAILDTRLYTRDYGQRVFNALPKVRHTDDIMEVRRFFDGTAR